MFGTKTKRIQIIWTLRGITYNTCECENVKRRFCEVNSVKQENKVQDDMNE